MAETRDIAVLVPGMLHPHARERIAGCFELVTLDKADPALVTEEMAARVHGMAAMTVVDAAFIDALPHLEIIANFGVGYDAVDAAHAGRRDVMVTNTPDVLTEEVADTAVGLLLNTLRELPRAETWLREGRWARDGAYRFSRGSLRGRTVGIFGMGRIGRAIAQRLAAFGLPIAYHNRRKLDDVPYVYHDTLPGLAAAVDTLICVAPGGPETHRAVNADVFEALGANGVFINIGRGSTVDEAALIQALQSGTIFAAGLDVFENEPHVPEALIALENASLLPHVGSASVATRQAMADLVVDNLVTWFTQDRAITPVPETGHVKRRSVSQSLG
ncbi:Lactate dehydrogenase [Nitratireductor aquibiodomus]|uniref:Lactate dehydrogenase n=2 Tax=Nitratireductor aquibiodomus TaxID=204799 RepID=A0A1H4JLC4_9HYPH|nr:Lactate dehydrogenase [Nitratireductor aquibiodomus]